MSIWCGVGMPDARAAVYLASQYLASGQVSLPLRNSLGCNSKAEPSLDQGADWADYTFRSSVVIWDNRPRPTERPGQ